MMACICIRWAVQVYSMFCYLGKLFIVVSKTELETKTCTYVRIYVYKYIISF